MKSKTLAENKSARRAYDVSRRRLLAMFAGALAVSTFKNDSWGREQPSPPDEMIRGDLHFASISDVAKLIEAKSLSPVDLTKMLLDRIETVDSRLHSYVTTMAEDALESARIAEAEIRAGKYRGPLHGIPIGVKDLCYTRGIRTMGGTKILADFVPRYDATVVSKLRTAGAIILGKQTLCEGAMGPYHPGLKVPVNPWNPERWSGVSSSGSGVATAAGLCFGAVGTDTGGSIRYPSAANGCVGLKPTYGRVSRYGVLALAESLDHVGPMTRTVEDCAIMFEAMAGHDPNDPTSRLEPVGPVRSGLAQGISGLRLGFDRRYSTDGVEPELVSALDAVLKQMTDLGAEVVEVEMPDVSDVGSAWWDLSTVEAASFHADNFPSRKTGFGPGFLDVLEHGASVTGVRYAEAAKVKAEIAGRVNKVLSTIDCMLCPSMSNSAQRKLENPFIPESEESWALNVIHDVHTKPFNFSGSPALSVPCGFSSDGLPLSAQFVGPALSEAVLFRVGNAYEKATRWNLRHPNA
jgi:amidase